MFLSNQLTEETVSAVSSTLLERTFELNFMAGQRTIADMIENYCVDEIVKAGGEKPATVRSIEDVSFANALIDIKTRDVNREFSMPNLISIKRLKKLTQPLFYWFIDYETDNNEARVLKSELRLIETIDWSVLSIQNLGLGQLQLTGVKDYDTIPVYDGCRNSWFNELNKQAIIFFDKQAKKFDKLKAQWSDYE